MALQPGLFGKMPAHGDFVRRGWDDATVAALDRWCGDAILRLRNHDEGENSGPGAASRRIYVPAGTFGRAALHVAVARSRDRAGRDFALVVGMAGTGAWLHARHAGDALEAVLRSALSGERDADATLAAVAATGSDVPAGHADAPEAACWWRDGEPVVFDIWDAATLADLLRARTAA